MVEERIWPVIDGGKMDRRCIDQWIMGDYDHRELDVHVSKIECPGASGGRI